MGNGAIEGKPGVVAARLLRAARSTYRRGGRAATAVSALALAGAAAFAVLPPPAAAEECPNAAFRTGPSSHLPDCRAYEMVSPPYKEAGAPSPVQVNINLNGSSLLAVMSGATASAEGYPDIDGFGPGVLYTMQRTSSGWESTPDVPRASEYGSYTVDGFTSEAGFAEDGPSESSAWFARGVWQPDNAVDTFVRKPDHSFVDFGPALPPTMPPGTPFEVGAAADLRPGYLAANASRYIFTLYKHFWPFDGTAENPGSPDASVYEYVGTGNTAPLLVGVDSSGRQIGRCGTVLGGSELGNITTSNHNAISADGNTVFFTVAACSGGPRVVELYARIDNGLPGARTVAISEPSKEDCAACDTEEKALANAYFQGASADGSKVFFTTTQPLLGGDTSTNIYEYDFDAPEGERVIRVSAGDASVSSPAAQVVLIEGGKSPYSSEDGSHAYFVAAGVLTTTPNAEGEAAGRGANNLYVFERDARFPAGHIAFVARLSERDLSLGRQIGSWSPDLTPDGRFLVFVSDRDLTPDDTSTARQIFEYDAQTGALVRVSIGEEGFNHNGNVALNRNQLGEAVNDAWIPSPTEYYTFNTGQQPPSHQGVSADGSDVFFQSPVGLTPQALDQKVIGSRANEGLVSVYANNIYEYHDGRVSLISDGLDLAQTEGSAVRLIGTGASGRDVFFTTTDRLVGQDTDTTVDLYDARVDGGFPAPVTPASCLGDACQGSLAAAPTLLSPGSEFQAGGNPPLAGGAAAKPKPKPKAKAKKPKRAKRKARGRRARRAAKASRGVHVNRRAARS